MINICSAISLTGIMMAAVWFDLHGDKIPNCLVLCGMASGVLLRTAGGFLSDNLWDIPVLIPEFLLLFFCLWPIYQVGGLGAGDCKLLLMAGIFLPVKQAFFIFTASLFIAAMGGVLLLLTGKLLKKKRGMTRIHFSIPVLGALLLSWVSM